jgi:hypothetical protein
MTLGLDDGGDVDGDADEEYGDVINVEVLVGINVGVSDGVIVDDSVCVTAGYSVHMIEGDVIGETEGNSVWISGTVGDFVDCMLGDTVDGTVGYFVGVVVMGVNALQ